MFTSQGQRFGFLCMYLTNPLGLSSRLLLINMSQYFIVNARSPVIWCLFQLCHHYPPIGLMKFELIFMVHVWWWTWRFWKLLDIFETATHVCFGPGGRFSSISSLSDVVECGFSKCSFLICEIFAHALDQVSANEPVQFF